MHLASVAHNETAVDVDGLARHVIGVTAGGDARDASHIFRSFGSPEWDQRASSLPTSILKANRGDDLQPSCSPKTMRAGLL